MHAYMHACMWSYVLTQAGKINFKKREREKVGEQFFREIKDVISSS